MSSNVQQSLSPPAVRREFVRPVRLWLGLVCALIIAMVCVGGITRLTGSGLSIVEWKPIMGAIPPLNDADWTDAFQKYQSSPQYQIVNQGMSLSAFKRIFFWEYLHRLLGRFIGFAFFVPWIVFALKRAFSRRFMFKTGVAFVLGGFQGVLGWYMVKSGLVNIPRVSHLRLAAHLISALILLVYLFSLYLETRSPDDAVNVLDQKAVSGGKSAFLRRGLLAFAGFLFVQIAYGAFVAGMRAGFSFNTFPKMGDEWVPSNLFAHDSLVSNLFYNPITVQFVHRTIAWALVLGFGVLYLRALRINVESRVRHALNAMGAVLATQFTLGVLTLIHVVPLSLATLHQLGAFILSLFTVRAIWVLGRDSVSNPTHF